MPALSERAKKLKIGQFGFPELPSNLDIFDWVSFKRGLEGSGWETPQCAFGYTKPPDIPAVYAFVMLDRNLFEKCAVAYVGMSRQVGTRFSNHPKYNEINKFGYHVMRYFLPVPESDLRDRERELIQKFNPPWNIQGKIAGITA